MLGYTHAAVGVTTALFYSNVRGMGFTTELIIPVVVGTIGGLVPDIDMYDIDDGTKNLKKRFKYIIIVMVLLMLLFWLLQDQISFDLLLSSIGLFTLMAIVCKVATSGHRHVSHSLMSMGIFTYSLIRINKNLGIVFMLAYGSHLLLDIINYKKVHLFSFVPKLKNGFCLKLLKADDQVANSVMTGIAIFLSFFILILMSRH